MLILGRPRLLMNELEPGFSFPPALVRIILCGINMAFVGLQKSKKVFEFNHDDRFFRLHDTEHQEVMS